MQCSRLGQILAFKGKMKGALNLGQIGAYIPASYAGFKLMKNIFTRVGSDDDMETNSSTFMLEIVLHIVVV
eukprot:Awhi_evm1s14646